MLHIVIFDEIDAICKKRGSVADSTGVSDSVVNQLLSKVDGVDSLNNVLIIGMTNRKVRKSKTMIIFDHVLPYFSRPLCAFCCWCVFLCAFFVFFLCVCFFVIFVCVVFFLLVFLLCTFFSHRLVVFGICNLV